LIVHDEIKFILCFLWSMVIFFNRYYDEGVI